MYDPHNEMDEVVSNGYRGKCELKDKKIQNHDAVCGTGIISERNSTKTLSYCKKRMTLTLNND